jgi:hypothetical protein
LQMVQFDCAIHSGTWRFLSPGLTEWLVTVLQRGLHGSQQHLNAVRLL